MASCPLVPPGWAGHSGLAPLKQVAAAALNRPMPSSPPLKTGLTCHEPIACCEKLAVSSASPVRRVGPRV